MKNDHRKAIKMGWEMGQEPLTKSCPKLGQFSPPKKTRNVGEIGQNQPLPPIGNKITIGPRHSPPPHTSPYPPSPATHGWGAGWGAPPCAPPRWRPRRSAGHPAPPGPPPPPPGRGTCGRAAALTHTTAAALGAAGRRHGGGEEAGDGECEGWGGGVSAGKWGKDAREMSSEGSARHFCPPEKTSELVGLWYGKKIAWSF